MVDRVSDRVARLRAAAGISQRELDRLAGFAPGHVGVIEGRSGAIALNTAAALARVFGVSIEALVTPGEPLPKRSEICAAVESARASKVVTS